MTRPQKASTEELLRAAEAAASEKPATWTLSDVGQRVGLCAATIVQRFGSKANLERELLVFLNERDNFTAQSKVGDIVTTSCKDRHEAGLLAYRMCAAVSHVPGIRRLAMGVTP
jgi:hypothetical protein